MMSDINWWLMALAFLPGLLQTFALTVRRVKREVPIYEALGRAPGVGDVDASATAKRPKVDGEATGKPPSGAGTGAVAAGAAAAGGAAATKFAGGRAGSVSETTKIVAVGDEPYGPGWIRVAASAGAPSGNTIKGKEDSMLYHSPDSPIYDAMMAERWFRDAEFAERVGFTRWDKGRVAAGGAARFADAPPGPLGPGRAKPSADGSGPASGGKADGP
jgi:uncharacterized membrane protein ArfC